MWGRVPHRQIYLGVWGFNPPPQIPAPIPQKKFESAGKIIQPPPPPQVEWHFHEIKVLEGVSEYKNSYIRGFIIFQTAIMGVKKSPEPTLVSAKLAERAVKILKIFHNTKKFTCVKCGKFFSTSR